MIDVIADFDDPALFAPWFKGSSWDTWRAVLKAAFGSPLYGAELELFKTVAVRDPPGQPVRELWVIAGRRSGKDSVASFLAAHLAVAGEFEHLRPGEKATILCLAVDKDQDKIVKDYTSGYFSRIPALQTMVSRETSDGIELDNGAEIVVGPNSYRAVRGRTILCAIFDECSFWRDENYSNPDAEVYNAIIPGMISLPDAMLIGISTPYRRSGLLFDTWHRAYGKDDPDTLVVQGASTVFNPLLLEPRQQSVISRALEADPERAGAEWLARWRTDLSDLITRAALEAAVRADCLELAPVSGIEYFAYCDPSGGSSDSMTLAIAHRDDKGRAILNVIREARPPFSPENVVSEFAALLLAYNIRTVYGDKYAGIWPAEVFERHLITYEVAERTTSEQYLAFLPILNSGRCELLDHPRMVGQFLCLERRTSAGGRDTITHPRGTHDDVATSVAGAVVMAAGQMDFIETWQKFGANLRNYMMPRWEQEWRREGKVA